MLMLMLMLMLNKLELCANIGQSSLETSNF